MANITTSLFQEMVQAGATRLNKQAEYVNSLNVFPVPDGDTGTNMGMTIENGAKEVSDRSASTVGEAAGIFAKGLLMGARGNSGVITSQLFRGFSQSVKDKEELHGAALAAALPAAIPASVFGEMSRSIPVTIALASCRFFWTRPGSSSFKRSRSSNSVCMI